MLQEMQSAIADLQTDMGTMSTDMGTMVSELVALKTTMGQGISSINTVGSDSAKHTLAADVVKGDLVASNTYYDVLQYKVLANGSIKYSGTLQFTASAMGQTATMGYKVNAGAWVDIVSITPAAGTIDLIGDKVIPIAYGDIVAIGAKTTVYSNHKQFKILAGATIGYDILDIVNDGAISIV